MTKILSICIPVFNKLNFTLSCIKDLSKLPNDHEIIIIDNGSTDGTKSEIENNKDITYIRSEENRGFAWGCNMGYNAARAPNVLFLNNDIRVKDNYESWTNSLIEKCSEGLVGPTMGQLDAQFNFVKEANCVLTGNSYLSGWCIASSKENWNKLIINNYLGPFSEEYFCYFEDTDLGMRSKQLKIPLHVVDIPVVHFGKTSSKQLNTAALYTNAKKIFTKKWKK